jgi:DNA-binding MarR family transcriptional regulator
VADDDPGDEETLAAQAWRAVYDFCRAEYARHLESAAELGLTPGDLKALLFLEPGEPRSMRSLADQWGSDASTVTWLIDRLQDRGYVERQAHTEDRRVKVVVLTSKGTKARADLLDRLYQPPPAIAALSPTQLTALRNLAPDS